MITHEDSQAIEHFAQSLSLNERAATELSSTIYYNLLNNWQEYRDCSACLVDSVSFNRFALAVFTMQGVDATSSMDGVTTGYRPKRHVSFTTVRERLAELVSNVFETEPVTAFKIVASGTVMQMPIEKYRNIEKLVRTVDHMIKISPDDDRSIMGSLRSARDWVGELSRVDR